MRRVLVIDNYDSFTYNLVHMLRELKVPTEVKRNDQLALEEVADYDSVLLSPGPGLPADAGLMPELIARYAGKKSILGVCLGHQALAEHFGGRLVNLPQVYHGVVTPIHVTAEDPILKGLPQTFEVCRYHSWIVDHPDFPDSLLITAQDADGTIMAFRHREFPLYGLQFHPESIMTPHGMEMIKNWIRS